MIVMPAKLPMEKNDYITKLTVLGYDRKEIAKKFQEKFGKKIAVSTISSIRLENKENIERGRMAIANNENIITTDVIKQKTYRMINRKLNRVERDEKYVDHLRNKLKAEEISYKQFLDEVKAYEGITVHELVKIAD